LLAEASPGMAIEELMSDFGACHSRWRMTHPPLARSAQGVVHLALASITNAVSIWAKSRGVPLWRLLLDLRLPKKLFAFWI